MLTPESVTSTDKKMTGSVFIMEAKSLAEVKKVVEEDVYYTSGVVNIYCCRLFTDNDVSS